MTNVYVLVEEDKNMDDIYISTFSTPEKAIDTYPAVWKEFKNQAVNNRTWTGSYDRTKFDGTVLITTYWLYEVTPI